jgi:hypothetical protein
MEKAEEDCNCHSADCIEGKFLQAVEAQLDTLLALAENGMLIPDELNYAHIIIITMRKKQSPPAPILVGTAISTAAAIGTLFLYLR